ncbi:MAG: hypothetical protein OXI67_16950 [Candidatus Poribacteria bacterium]|nr:hypothetical protein [Candidatus Poribacteria bacterium]
MKRLFNFALTLLFLISICFTSPVTTDSKEKSGAGSNNPQVYGYIYISDSPYSYWDDNDFRVMTLTDHGFDVYNFAEKSCSYEYEYKQWLSEYDPVQGEAGDLINEDKGFGNGSLDVYDEDPDDNDHQASDGGFQSHYLLDWNLEHNQWYQVGGYTRLVVNSRKGSDSWDIESETMEFRWRDPNN